MNTAVLPMAGEAYRVKGSLLLSLYLIIPLCLALAAIDYLFLDYNLRNWLPSNPATLLFWAVIFNFPHIVSSVLTLADKEYLQFYKKKLIRGLVAFTVLVITVETLIPIVLPRSAAMNLHYLFFLFVAIYTMHHVLSQQFGIGMMFMKVPRNKQFEAWRWLATLASTLMYMCVFGRSILRDYYFGDYSGVEIAQAAAGIFVILAVVQGAMLTKSSKSRLGTQYVYSNLAMILATYLFLFLDYQAFVIAIPRFVHDITAFIIYSVHDQNRNTEVKHNYFYRWLAFVPLSPILLCPVLAIVLANTVECGFYLLDVSLGFYAKGTGDCIIQHYYAPSSTNGLPFTMQMGLQVVFIVSLFHYYIESFVWRRESIHRHSVQFDAS